MSKYRFKTKEEFVQDRLWNNKHNCPKFWSPIGEMNKYLGTDVPDEFNVYCDKKEDFYYDGWFFKRNEYVLKEQQKYFPDLSQHIGRYIRALIDNPNLGSGVYKGDIGKIINKGQVDFPNRKGYSCTCALDKNHLGTKYELLPEDYSPEQKIKESSIEFIPGKWYNFTTMKGKYSLYVKVSSVTDKSLFFMNGKSISNGHFGEAICIELKLIENPRLVEDLSEIQKYLPNEHPDKVKNFKPEVGKWYSFNWDFSGKDHIVIAKIKKVEEDYFAVSWRSYLWLDKSYSDSDAYRFKDISNIKELSIKEIQPYLPIGHPDKITSSEFKKGEYIVLIGDGQSTTSARLVQDSNQFIKNYCYKVRENNTFLRIELDSNGSTTNGWECIPYNPNQFHKTRNWRYATQEEIDEYERRGKPYDVTELNKQSFPDEGSIEIEYIPKNLMSYLENNNRKSVSGDSSYNKEKVVIAWNKSSFWFCSVESSKPKYSKDFIEKIIGKSIYSNTILEAKKELSMKEIQEECKRRFPIGCTFIAVGSCMHRILKEDSYTYSIVGKQIWTHYGAGYLYKNGKWAELVSLPKQNDLKEEAIKYSEETNATILLASNIKSKELHSTYGNTSLSVKLLSNKTTHLINSVREISSVNLKIK